MSNWPLLNGGARYETLGNQNSGVALAATGTTHALGAWTSIGTTGFEYNALLFSGVVTATRVMIDLGIGTGGSQQAIATQLFWDSNGNTYGSAILLPLAVPDGVELWGRQRCASASQQAAVNITGIQGEAITPWPAGARLVELLNPSTGTTTVAGTITGSGSSGSDSSWAELVASTSRDYAALYVMLTAQADYVRTASAVAFDLAIGGSGSEIEVLSNIVSQFESNRAQAHTYAGPFLMNLPAGTRLAGRVRCNSASADSFGVAVLGVVP